MHEYLRLRLESRKYWETKKDAKENVLSCLIEQYITRNSKY